MDKFAAMRIFCAVVDEGGFSAAARRLKLSKSAVSTSVRDIEAYLGVALLNRTTRSVSLTEAGRRYKERADQILADLEEADLEAAALTQIPRGVLKISAGVSFGARELSKTLAPYMAIYPDVTIELNLADRYVDVVEEGFDLAVRIGRLVDSSLFVRRITTTRRIVCAAPTYLDRYGTPDIPEDLAGHRCLNYSLLATGNTWDFLRNGAPLAVPTTGPMTTNNGDALRQAALDGLGIFSAPSFIVGDDLREGRLVPILSEFEVAPSGIHALYPHNRHVSAKVRSFIDFLVGCFGDPPQWEHDLPPRLLF